MSRTKFEPSKAVEEINGLMASLGGIGGADLGEAKTGTAMTAPMSDAHDKIRARRALEKEQSGGGSGDMAQISASTLDQISLLGILHEDNMKIINLLTPSDLTGSEETASTMTQNNNPATPAQYGGWQQGTSSKNTTRGVT